MPTPKSPGPPPFPCSPASPSSPPAGPARRRPPPACPPSMRHSAGAGARPPALTPRPPAALTRAVVPHRRPTPHPPHPPATSPTSPAPPRTGGRRPPSGACCTSRGMTSIRATASEAEGQAREREKNATQPAQPSCPFFCCLSAQGGRGGARALPGHARAFTARGDRAQETGRHQPVRQRKKGPPRPLSSTRPHPSFLSLHPALGSTPRSSRARSASTTPAPSWPSRRPTPRNPSALAAGPPRPTACAWPPSAPPAAAWRPAPGWRPSTRPSPASSMGARFPRSSTATATGRRRLR